MDVQEILTETAQKVGEAWEETEDKVRHRSLALKLPLRSAAPTRLGRTPGGPMRTPPRCTAAAAAPAAHNVLEPLFLRRLTLRCVRLAVSQPAVVTLLAFGFVGLWATAGILKARADRAAYAAAGSRR